MDFLDAPRQPLVQLLGSVRILREGQRLLPGQRRLRQPRPQRLQVGVPLGREGLHQRQHLEQ